MNIDLYTRPTDPPGCTFDVYGLPEPEGAWAYELDDHGITYGYGSWPYYRDGQPCSIRLAPNTAFVSWRNHYVLVNPTGDPTGAVRYRIRGRRAAGTIIIGPEFRGSDQPIPISVYVQFGEHALREHERADRPVINGIPLVGGVILTPADYLAQPHRNLWLRRSTGPYTSVRVPEATARYGTAIVRALVAAWHARPDRDALIRTAAQRTAAGRLAELHQSKIKPIQAEIERLQRELFDHHHLADELRQLADEHAHQHPTQDSHQA